jgi:hypothetical protein
MEGYLHYMPAKGAATVLSNEVNPAMASRLALHVELRKESL